MTMGIAPREFACWRMRSRRLGDMTIVAPIDEASAIGHALTLRRPLRLETIGERLYAVDGTPTDCVNIAVTQVFKGLPDLVVSGINKGWNLGDDVTYSGTVAGALEAALLGVPGIAVSLAQTRGAYDFGHAAAAAASHRGSDARASAAAPDVSQRQRAERAAEGLPRHRAGEAQSRDVGCRARTIRRDGRISGSRKGRTSGSRTIGPTIRRCATATCR